MNPVAWRATFGPMFSQQPARKMSAYCVSWYAYAAVRNSYREVLPPLLQKLQEWHFNTSRTRNMIYVRVDQLPKFIDRTALRPYIEPNRLNTTLPPKRSIHN